MAIRPSIRKTAAAKLTILAIALGLSPARAQTKIDLQTQVRGVEKQGTGSKFQMFTGPAPSPRTVAVYSSDGSLLAGDCTIDSGTMACGDGSRLSTLELPELLANGPNAFVIHGAPSQDSDGCIVLSGQPGNGHVLKATNLTIIDDEGRTCVLMQWADPAMTAPPPHAASHRPGGSDEIASATAAPNAIPKSDGSGTLGSAWLPNPTATSKGAVQAKNCTSSGTIASINADSSVTCGSIATTTVGGDLGGTIGGATVSRVNGVTYPASPNVDSSPVVSGANSVTYVAIPNCRDTGGNHLNYDPTTHAFTCGSSSSGATAAATFWQNTASDRSSSIGLGAPSQIRGVAVYLPYAVTVSKILVYIPTADPASCSSGNNCYAVGLYDTLGKLAAHTTPASLNSTGATDLVIAEGTVTLSSGWYFYAFTGSASTAKIGISNGTDCVVPAGFGNVYLGMSTGGELPAYLSPPQWNNNLTNSNCAFVALHQ